MPADGKEAKDSDKSPINDRVAVQTLVVLLKSVLHFALIMAVFGQTYSALALDIYGGVALYIYLSCCYYCFPLYPRSSSLVSSIASIFLAFHILAILPNFFVSFWPFDAHLPCSLIGSLLSHGDGPNLMRAYAFYLVLLAINGITELFSTAASKTIDHPRGYRWMCR